MDEARAAAPGRRVEVWAFDEHRLGLKPLARRVWAKLGQRPSAATSTAGSLYGFVRPASGEVEWWIASAVNVALFQAVLDAFAETVGAGQDQMVVLTLDNTGRHVSK